MCCAGISGGGPAVDFSIEEFRRIHEVNVLGTFVCCQAAGKEFKKQNQTGSVVLVASMSAHGSNKVSLFPSSSRGYQKLISVIYRPSIPQPTTPQKQLSSNSVVR